MRSRLHQMLWSLGILLAAAGLGQAAVFQATLDNGLTVLIEENHANPVVAAEVFVRTGSIYEQEYLGSGISHFFEHIIHGGTTSTRSEAESHRLLEGIGDNSNAYTTVDHTAYYINTTTEHWRTALPGRACPRVLDDHVLDPALVVLRHRHELFGLCEKSQGVPGGACPSEAAAGRRHARSG